MICDRTYRAYCDPQQIEQMMEYVMAANADQDACPEGKTCPGRDFYDFCPCHKLPKDSSNFMCPFCSSGDFDLVGLKNHISKGHCDEFNNTCAI